MTKAKAVMDPSFLYNSWQLKILHILCVIFEKILLVPSVISECKRFQKKLLDLPCSEQINLDVKEKEKATDLHKEFVLSFPGKHHGEIECLVVAQSRNIPLIISDNFAPWFLREQHLEYHDITIHRGWWVIGRLIEHNYLSPEFLNELEGRYSQKALRALRKTFRNEPS